MLQRIKIILVKMFGIFIVTYCDRFGRGKRFIRCALYPVSCLYLFTFWLFICVQIWGFIDSITEIKYQRVVFW